VAELRSVRVEDISIPEVRVSSILDDEQRALLKSTVQTVGVIQDIVVRELPGGKYELTSGRSRLRELVEQGHTEITVKVTQTDEKTGLIMNIVENVARGTYDYVSVSQAIRKLKQLGATPEELDRVFPWTRSYIAFLEGLQDLPEDVQMAIKEKKLTPTHVRLSLDLPTPYEVHDGLRSAVIHGWNTETFKIFVQNRVQQIEGAKKTAAAMGTEPTIPAAKPVELVQYQQCLLCGYKVPREKVTTQLVCEGCTQLVKYITSQLGDPDKAMSVVYNALIRYFGQPPSQTPAVAEATAGSSQE